MHLLEYQLQEEFLNRIRDLAAIYDDLGTPEFMGRLEELVYFRDRLRDKMSRESI
jgi:hypothetical protein